MTPLKVKIFREFSKSIHPPTELQINSWLEDHPDIEVVHLLQSESMTSIRENDVERNLTVTLFYR